MVIWIQENLNINFSMLLFHKWQNRTHLKESKQIQTAPISCISSRLEQTPFDFKVARLPVSQELWVTAGAVEILGLHLIKNSQ